ASSPSRSAGWKLPLSGSLRPGRCSPAFLSLRRSPSRSRFPGESSRPSSESSRCSWRASSCRRTTSPSFMPFGTPSARSAKPPSERATLALDRGGLEVRASDQELYTRLVKEIQIHSAPGAFIYAAPDAPHVYFLSARQNPTRTLYDFFDQDLGTDLAPRTLRIPSALEERQVKVVVIN